MPKRTSPTGSELFIVDNSVTEWKVVKYLHDWCDISKRFDIATGYFEIGALLSLGEEWQKVDKIRILMGDEVSLQTRKAFEEGLAGIVKRLDDSLEAEKNKNDFLNGVDAIVAALKSGKIECRVYKKEKFHAKCYITHGRKDVIGSFALVGSSNFTHPGLNKNIELNVQIKGTEVAVLQEWYEDHWKIAEDVTLEILKTVERHTREYSPFEVYARSLHELFRDATPGEQKWEEEQSRMFKVLDGYQRDGYRNLLNISRDYGGAFLCDGVGLGKTFVGLMLIERLIVRDGKNVILLAPKGAIESVWKPAISHYLKKLSGGAFTNLFIASHTDLGREKTRDLFEAAKQRAHAIVVDEAHHFRNPGAAGTGVGFIDAPRKLAEQTKVGSQQSLFPEAKISRYREMFNLIPSPDGTHKRLFMLTATPINNSFHDLRHMIELITQKKQDYFAQQLGIHNLTAHFKRMEKTLDEEQPALLTDSVEARKIMAADPLVSTLIVQRSRAFVKSKQVAAGMPVTAFPPRNPPKKVEYSLKKVYGRLLDRLEAAFLAPVPLFTMPLYYPLFYYRGPKTDFDPGDENRQKEVVALIRTSFLKRFESSVTAFRESCERLLIKSLAFVAKNADTDEEKTHVSDWQGTHVKLLEDIRSRQPEFFSDSQDEEEDFFEEEWFEDVLRLDRAEYRVGDMLDETMKDLDQLLVFFAELSQFDHRNDDKIKTLVKLLKTDPVMSNGKVLIFSEFGDTAEYLYERLSAEGVSGVEKIDGMTSGKQRLSVIRRFSPYYNASTSGKLADNREAEIRVLVSTDVLSEGLNLQDVARLINYDLHWNPVRLMQRIGRVDRRRNPGVEALLAADHPDLVEGRKFIQYYNFLPPDELNRLLTLYSNVTRKTLRISKALGIEGKKLLHEDDDFQDLQHFNESYEGKKTAKEELEVERDQLFNAHPELEARVMSFPLRIFSGKAHPKPGTRAVFFCFTLPFLRNTNTTSPGEWTTDGGPCRWVLVDIGGKHIVEEPTQIADFIRSKPNTPRVVTDDHETLAGLRATVEKHFKNGYLKSLQAPLGVKPVLKAWMELN